MAAPGLTARGIAALRAGDHAAARALLAAAVRADPADAQAWLWLSGALPEPAAQRYCLERALALDPACGPARAGLAALAQGDERATAHGAAVAPALPGAPWRLIWRRPRAAFRAALARRSPWAPWPLAALAGVAAALSWAAWARLGAALGPGALLALALVAGAPLGAAALLLAGVLLRTGGRLLGGRAGAGQVRAALGLAVAPVVAGLPLWLTQLALLPAASFGAPHGQAQGLLAAACGAVHAALWAWAAALSVVGLAEAHGLPLWRAAASWLVAALAALAGAVALLGGAALVIGLLAGR